LGVLELLKSHEIYPGSPDINNSNLTWGIHQVPGGETKQLPPKERINVFASHLKYILDLAQKYPDLGNSSSAWWRN